MANNYQYSSYKFAYYKQLSGTIIFLQTSKLSMEQKQCKEKILSYTRCK